MTEGFGMSRIQQLRAWWSYCQKNQRYLDTIPFFEDFVKTLPETVDTKPETPVHFGY